MIRTAYDIAIRKGRTTLVALEGFECPAGRITLLFGESGIGKSLTARALFGLLDPADLSVTINGHSYDSYCASGSARRMREHGFFVFQEPSSHLNPLMTLREQISEGSLAGGDRQRILHELWRDSAPADVEHLLSVYPKPHRPSGGEKQRMLCAMALLRMESARTSRDAAEGLFVFDEPTGSLDNRSRDTVLGSIADAYRRHPVTVLLITHDYSMISVISERWQDILDRVTFKEMVLTPEGQRQRDFAPATYTSWIRAQHPVEPEDPGHEMRRELLHLKPHLNVFGRGLTIAGADRTTPRALTISPGRMVYLKAPSGTGKTTLAKMIMGLVRGGHFAATLAGIRLSGDTPHAVWEKSIWGRAASMVFQHADEALNLRSRVREVFHGLPGINSSQEELRRTVLDFFGGGLDTTFLDRRVGSLSGGQKQRLNLLRSLLLETPLLILDEPLNGLDFASMQRVLLLMQERLSRGQGILLISHNEEIFDALIPPGEVYHLVPDGLPPSQAL